MESGGPGKAQPAAVGVKAGRKIKGNATAAAAAAAGCGSPAPFSVARRSGASAGLFPVQRGSMPAAPIFPIGGGNCVASMAAADAGNSSSMAGGFPFPLSQPPAMWGFRCNMVSGVKWEGNFLNKNDPKVATLLQQADLLCSLATKIKSDSTSQRMDEAWQVCMAAPNSCYDYLCLEELDDLIVDPYESKDEDEQKLSEHNGQSNVDNDHCNGSSQTSIEVTSNMVPEEIMEDCPVDNCKEDSSLCRNVLSGSTEPCPGAKILACGNLSNGQVAE